MLLHNPNESVPSYLVVQAECSESDGKLTLQTVQQ